MPQKYLLSFDPGAGGDFFNHIVSQNYGYCKAKTEPGINNNTIYYNPTNDLGIEFKQIPMVLNKNNIFGLPECADILGLNNDSKQLINSKINLTYVDKLCLGTHWYDTDTSKFILDNTTFVKLESKPQYIGLFYTLVFLKNWDHIGYLTEHKRDLVELTMSPTKAKRFLDLVVARGWERYVIDWDVPVRSITIKDSFEPLFNEFKNRFIIKEYSDNWNYIDIGDLWFKERKDLERVNKLYGIELNEWTLNKWANDNLKMINDKFKLTLDDFSNDNWIKPVKQYFLDRYNE